MLASASGAIIIGFNVRANPRVTELAEKEKVDIRYYDVIYNLIQDIKLAMAGLLARFSRRVSWAGQRSKRCSTFQDRDGGRLLRDRRPSGAKRQDAPAER